MNQNGGCCPICKLVGLLVIVGALNWGLIGAFNLNLVNQLLGSMPMVEKIIYILVGLAGLLKIVSCFKPCPCSCAKKPS